MANSEVWTIRGVSEEARKRAKARAAEAGMTQGEWLEGAIMREAYPVNKVKKTRKTLDQIHEVDVVNEQVQDWSMNAVAIEAGHVAYVAETVVSGPVSAEVQEAVARVPGVVGPVLEESTAKKGRTRSCCQHGTEKGFNCWQCGGLAVIR